jgi:hypothetical protein
VSKTTKYVFSTFTKGFPRIDKLGKVLTNATIPQKKLLSPKRCMSHTHGLESINRCLAETEGADATASDTIGDRGPGAFRGFQFECRDERAGDGSGNGDKCGR